MVNIFEFVFQNKNCCYNVFFVLEPETVHVVSTFIELPEGASLSDNEDKDHYDVNDPHRALDIDLDV